MSSKQGRNFRILHTHTQARVFSRSLKKDGGVTGTIHSAAFNAPFRCVGPSNRR